MTIDVDTPLLNRLVVDGKIVFGTKNTSRRLLQNETNELVLKAKQLWIRAGSIEIGNSTNPYTAQAAIELHGNFNDEYLLIDQYVTASNKVFAVTGNLSIYAGVPGTVWTRLTSFADAGATSITVDSADGWEVGDELVIGPSGRDPTQNERLTITAISGKTVTLANALLYPHFGAPTVTVTASGIG